MEILKVENLCKTYKTGKVEVKALDNISFTSGGKIKVDSNTKSSKVVTLTVGDNYTDSDLMKFMKSKGYSCK